MPNIFLIIIVFIAGLAIEALGTAISVIGVSAMFGGNLIIIAFILAIDIGKIVTISAAYNYWERMGIGLRTFSIMAITITMLISSSGAAGYFSGEFQKAMIGNQSAIIKVDALKAQIAKYEERKKQIDNQIAALPSNYASSRIKIMNAFKAEQQELSKRITEIEQQLPELQTDQLTKSAKAGPILAIATALNIPLEWAINFVIGLLILVFNPFAVFLVTLANFLIKERTKAKAALSHVEIPQKEIHIEEPQVAKEEPIAQPTEVAEVIEEPVVKESVVEEPVAEEPVVEESVEEIPNVTAEEPITISFNEEINIKVADSLDESKIEPFTERRITKVANLPEYKSLLLDEMLNHIVDHTDVDAYNGRNTRTNY